MKKIMIFTILVFAVIGLYFLDGNRPSGNVVMEQPIQVYFCPQEDCSGIIAAEIKKSSNVDCAFYNFDDKRIILALEGKQYRIFSDNNYVEKLGYLGFVRFDTKSSLMHNKFCILDGKKIITGSFNPVTRASKDLNNLIIIESEEIAQTYEEEFVELWEYEKNSKSEKNEFGDIKVYFCPEDGCQKALISEIENAKESIFFMTYSFTDKQIANSLLLKSKDIRIQGIYEKSQLKDSTYDLLEYQGLDVHVYDGTGLLHNKVFIIDDIVVTGSYNPTNNGNRANDENMMIINDKGVAELYRAQFHKIYRNLNIE